MIVVVESTRGPSSVNVEVQCDDERTARKVAYRWVYYGDTIADDEDAEFPVTDDEIDEYTAVISVVATITPSDPD